MQIHPKVPCYPRLFAEALGHVGAGCPRFADDIIDSREVQGRSQLIGGNAHRLHEFRAQNLPRMNGVNADSVQWVCGLSRGE